MTESGQWLAVGRNAESVDANCSLTDTHSASSMYRDLQYTHVHTYTEIKYARTQRPIYTNVHTYTDKSSRQKYFKLHELKDTCISLFSHYFFRK